LPQPLTFSINASLFGPKETCIRSHNKHTLPKQTLKQAFLGKLFIMQQLLATHVRRSNSFIATIGACTHDYTTSRTQEKKKTKTQCHIEFACHSLLASFCELSFVPRFV